MRNPVEERHYIVMTAEEAERVRGETIPGHRLEPVVLPDGRYILPTSVLSDRAHGKHLKFLLDLPVMSLTAPEEPPGQTGGFFAVNMKDGETTLFKDGRDVASYSQPSPPRRKRTRHPILSKADRFVGSKLKIERAKRHISDLETAVQAFFNKGPYQLIGDVDAKTGENVVRVLVNEHIPIELSAILGDAIHNLRAALDYLVCDLIRGNGDTERHYDRGFPIDEKPKVFKAGRVSKKIKGVNARAERMIRLLKANSCSNTPLFTLNWLDVIDKHNAIVPVATATLQITAMVAVPGTFISPAGALCIGGGPPGSKPYMVPAGTPAHFKRVAVTGNDVEIHRSPGGFREEVQITFAVAFNETKIAEGQPVVETLRQLTEFVERVLEVFERHFQAP